MAEEAAKTAQAQRPFPDKSVTADWLARLEEARAQKALVEPDLQEAYFFTRPRLARQVSSRTAVTAKTAVTDDAAELATGLGPEVSEDFATEVIAAFFPPKVNWAESTGDAALLAGADENQLSEFKDAAKAYDDRVFAGIRMSNFNSELGIALDPDAGVGTIGLWINAPGGGRPYKVEHVPARELEFTLDPDGNPGDRFRVRHVRGDKLPAVIGDVPLPEKTRTKIRNQKGKCVIEVVWCFGRDWSKPKDDVYDHVLLVDKQAVHQTQMSGEGCLPLLIMRFSPDKLHSWGNGPAIKSLPELRVLDAITAATQDRVDIAIEPPIGFPDDGVMNFEGGLEKGRAYPMRPGSGKDIVPLYFQGDPDLGFYTATDIERRIRRKFFADYPEQKGDTPPTATQWIDEMVRAQRRIGTPGLKFWEEGPSAVFRRFAYLLEKDGKAEAPKIGGVAVPLTPNNPATQAQDNQKLQVASQLLGLVKSYFPVTSQAAIDEHATIKKMQDLAKDEVIVLRDQQQVEQLVSQVLGAVAGGAGGPPAAE